MKGIILAGGTGTRLYPLTKVTNKHLLPVYNKPMIYYPLQQLINAKITNVMIVSGKEHVGQFIELLGSGKEFNISLTYKVQEDAGGIAEALGLCEDWCCKDDVVAILGDNISDWDVSDSVGMFDGGAHLFIKEVEHPERFGVVRFENNEIVEIVEKPISPPSNYIVTGIYIYDHKVFEYIKNLKPSNRGELEITDVNNWYLNNGELSYSVIEGFWSDAGTIESLYAAGQIIRMNELNCCKECPL
jgi:glucose-1-phosphate thymidylyltransferase